MPREDSFFQQVGIVNWVAHLTERSGKMRRKKMTRVWQHGDHH